jgi:hypothetical protein
MGKCPRYDMEQRRDEVSGNDEDRNESEGEREN